MTLPAVPPCKECISMAVCRQTGACTNGVSTLAMKCHILDEYLTKDNGEWDLHYMYKAYVYFDRGYKNDNS